MMHPQFRIDVLHERSRALQAGVDRAALVAGRSGPAPAAEEQVALRLCSVHDDEALERLAQLEGKPVPRGQLVVAEVDGELRAALPLAGGVPLADPFRPTAHLLPLLRLRAAQIEQALAGSKTTRLGLFSVLRGRA